MRQTNYDNGLRLLIAEKPNSHEEASITLRLPYGYANCTQEKRQAAHLLEHMLLRSTPRRRWVDTSRELDTMAVEIDAEVKIDRTVVSLMLPGKYLSPVAGILYDLFQNTDFDIDEFEKEKETIDGEMARRRSDPEVYGDDALFETAFNGHPLGQTNDDSIRTLKREDIVATKNEHFHPDHLVMAVVGSVPSETEDVIGQTFGSLPRGGISKTRFSKPCQRQAVFREEREIDSSYLSRGWVVPGLESMEDLFALYFLEHLLGGTRDLYQFSSRLYYRLVTEEGLGYTAMTDYSAFLGCGIFRAELVGTSQKNIEVAKRLIDEETERLRTQQIPEDEFECARQTLNIGELRDCYHSADSLSSAMSGNALKGLPIHPESFVEQVNRLTPSKIMEVARKYFTDQHVTVEIVGTGKD